MQTAASRLTRSHAHPNFPHNEDGHPTIPLPDPSLSDLESHEALYAYQSGNPMLNPPLPIEALTPTSLLAGRITESPRTAVAAFEALLRHGIIDEETRTPVAEKITSRFAPDIYVLSVVQAKELVKLLLYWDQQIRVMRGERVATPSPAEGGHPAV
ncbi:hypothetical protein GQ53DRAFT_348642 [Thozetella sp. PMI_491]|nr:hypothetical protein GQ53DRAFT_348642 [Thozetella sp. PMI_491]